MKVLQLGGAAVSALVAILAVNLFGDGLYSLATPEGSQSMPLVTHYAPAIKLGANGKPEPISGAQATAVCKACHSLEKDGPNKIGPALWGVVGRPIASKADFAYSEAVKGLGGEWTEERLGKWLTSPKAFAPGTKMGFAGYSDPEPMKAAVEYLKTLR